MRRRQPTLGRVGKGYPIPGKRRMNTDTHTTEKILFVERIKRSVKQGLHCSVSKREREEWMFFKIRSLGCG